MTRSENSFAFKCFYQSDHPKNTGQTSFKDRNANTQINVHPVWSYSVYRITDILNHSVELVRLIGVDVMGSVFNHLQRKANNIYTFLFSHEFQTCKHCHFLLTVTLVRLLPLIWVTVFPVELSTHESDPYSMLTGVDGGSRFTRWTIGLLAQPRDSDMALKPTSPLRGKENKIHYCFYICKEMHL